MTHSFTLPDGRTLNIRHEAPRLYLGWIEGRRDMLVGGWPLSGVIMDAIGLHPAHDEPPAWLDAFAERVAEQLEQDGTLFDAEKALLGATFVHARWSPPPPEWVSVMRDEDGGYGAMSMRTAPGPPSWSRDDPPAWDHDHCELCRQRITDDSRCYNADASGWRTGCDWGSYAWVCETCFTAFEAKLGFTRGTQ